MQSEMGRVGVETLHATLRLKAGRDKSLKNRHPWVFSGAVATLEGEAQPGDIVHVYNAQGEFLAQGFYNPHSQIRVRLLSFDAQPLNPDFFKARLRQAVQFREKHLRSSNARRLVNSEADGLPGLIVDQYNDVLVLQISSAGMLKMKDFLQTCLRELCPHRMLIERSEAAALKEEGLEGFSGVLSGEGETETIISEDGARFYVDALRGQKTGFFIDQRDNRRLLGQWAAQKKLLNCFSYTGGFSVHAALQGATTTSVDVSARAQEVAQRNFELNGLNPTEHHFVTADVFEYLRQMQPEYDVIVLDPPAFVKQRKHLKKACRAYQDINRIAMQKSRPDGLLLSCSCSHFLDWELFQKVIFSAAAESGRRVQILQRLGQAADHPVSLFHPEGEYLKAFLLRVL